MLFLTISIPPLLFPEDPRYFLLSGVGSVLTAAWRAGIQLYKPLLNATECSQVQILHLIPSNLPAAQWKVLTIAPFIEE